METISQNNSKKINILEQSGHPGYFRRDVHELLEYGYMKVRSTINANTEEPTITIRIAKAIKDGLDSIGELPDKFQYYNVTSEEAEIKAKDPNNIKDTHVFYDIVFVESTRTIPRRRYTFEGKRLKKNNFPKTNNFPIRLYCNDGIMRFVNDIYASDSPEAAMIAFFQDEDVNYWFGELTRKFKENEQDNKMQVLEGLTQFQVISKFSNEWFSIHQRITESPVILFHIFLDCV